MAKQKQTPKADAGQGAASYYERIPSSKEGEFAHAQAQLADLNQNGSTESRRTGDGVAVK
jgi:hypothetical protein